MKKLDHSVTPTSIDHLPVDNVSSQHTGNITVNGCAEDEDHIPGVVLHRYITRLSCSKHRKPNGLISQGFVKF